MQGIQLKSFLLSRRGDIEFLTEAKSIHYALIWIMEVILNDTLTTWMLHTSAFWFSLNKGTKDIVSGLSLQYTWSEVLNISLITRFPIRCLIQCCFKLHNIILISWELLNSPSSNIIKIYFIIHIGIRWLIHRICFALILLSVSLEMKS